MRSFFRSPNDISSSIEDTSPERSGYDDPEQSSEDAQGVSRIRTLSSDASGADQSIQNTRVVPQERDLHKDLLLHSLLEDKALSHVIQSFNKGRSGPDDHVYSANDHEVRKLAKAKYEFMSEQLASTGLLDPEHHDEGLRQLRDRYRNGLDTLLASHDAAVDSLPGPSNVLNNALGPINLQTAFEKVAITRNDFARHIIPQIGPDLSIMPSALHQLIESHQIIRMSRYEREFVQLGVLGKGGYGKVFKCQHRLDGMEYAVKQIVLSSTKIQRIKERGQSELDNVLAEIRTVARLDHPNIVRYYGGWLEYAPVEGGVSDIQRLSPSPKLLQAASQADVSDTDSKSADPFDGHFIPGQDIRAHGQDLDVVFENSGRLSTLPDDSSDADTHGKATMNEFHSSKPPSKRRESSATISSNRSKKSTVHSIGVSEGGPEDDIETIPRPEISLEPSTSMMDSYASSSRAARLSNTNAEPRLTLHIQMGVHPMTLTDFLNTEIRTDEALQANDSQKLKHCYHKRTSLKIILVIMDGVDYLHAAGMIHRDLKPSNIFLSPVHTLVAPVGCVDLSRCETCTGNGVQGRGHLAMRIGDFGLVTAIARPEDVAVNATQKAVGTEFYRPDTVSCVATEKLDVFSLGVILFELLWKLDTKMERHETLKALKTGQLPQDFSSTIGNRSGEIEACIKGMVEDDEKVRLSCSEARDIIVNILLEL